MKKITKIGVNETLIQKKKLKVAAYCRVSTASDEQLISLEAQKAHYENYIRSNDEWEYVGLYYRRNHGYKKGCPCRTSFYDC